MKKLAAIFFGILSVLSPIQLSILVLMFMMLIDFTVKMISLKKIAIRDKRMFWDVFNSRVARQGYLYKSAGYFIFGAALFPLDYFFLTPFVIKLSVFSGFENIFTNPAIMTNGILIIFSVIELGSINENWVDVSGNNILRTVYNTLTRIKSFISDNVNFLRGIKK